MSNTAKLRVIQDLRPLHVRFMVLHVVCIHCHTLPSALKCTSELLRSFSGTLLEEITVELSCYRALHVLSAWLTSEANAPLCKELEYLLLQFPLPTISVSSPVAIDVHRKLFWTQAFGWYFPTLYKRGRVAVQSRDSTGTSVIA